MSSTPCYCWYVGSLLTCFPGLVTWCYAYSGQFGSRAKDMPHRVVRRFRSRSNPWLNLVLPQHKAPNKWFCISVINICIFPSIEDWDWEINIDRQKWSFGSRVLGALLIVHLKQPPHDCQMLLSFSLCGVEVAALSAHRGKAHDKKTKQLNEFCNSKALRCN